MGRPSDEEAGQEFTSNLRRTVRGSDMVSRFACLEMSVPSVLQDIIFVAVVVIVFIALFRVSEGVGKWFEDHFRKPSSHSRRREGAHKK